MLHLQKLSVGTQSIDSLKVWQNSVAMCRAQEGRKALPDHITRMTPKRDKELLANGSIYWIIKGIMQCRNRILDLEEMHTDDGRRACRIVLDPLLVAVNPVRKRAFQGWRYLQPMDVPADLGDYQLDSEIPEALRIKLLEIGVW